MKPEAHREDRRQYKRVRAPVYCRHVGIRPTFGRKQAVDISLGGMRIFADEEPKKGSRLELELFLPDRGSVTCVVEVVWVDVLPLTAEAPYDVGLKFVDIRTEDRQRLAEVLDDES